jgi:hypothetical protein
MSVTRIQMAPVIDSISDDGEHVGSRLPYPYYVDDEGFVQMQDFWNGEVFKVVGFQNHPAVQTIDLWWYKVQEPAEIIGKYLVTMDKGGTWSTWPTAVVEAEKLEECL